MDKIIKRLEKKYYLAYKNILSTEQIDSSFKWLKENIILKALKADRQNIIKTLEKIDKEKWDDAIHCTCLSYAINVLKDIKE